MPKLISVVIHTYNEEDNVKNIYGVVRLILLKQVSYDYEIIFIDNSSTDRTVGILKELAARDKRLKIIVNTRNFGHIRSPNYGLLQAGGDGVIAMCADFQDPPSVIPKLIREWERGTDGAVAVKTTSDENHIVYMARSMYYFFLRTFSDAPLVDNFSGYALYDKRVIDVLKTIDDPNPYIRGLVCDLGFNMAQVEYRQPKRKFGYTKNNIYTLYDIAVLGLTTYSKMPLRLMVLVGGLTSFSSMLVALIYLLYKLIYWDSFTVGVAPLVIGLFFFSSLQILFLGIIGEYIGMIASYIQKRPLVIERERINFE